MQRAEMEELRHREANNTALQAIGPRKKPRLDSDAATTVVSLIIFKYGKNLFLILKCFFLFVDWNKWIKYDWYENVINTTATH